MSGLVSARKALLRTHLASDPMLKKTWFLRISLITERARAHQLACRALPPGYSGARADELNAALDRLEELPVVKQAKAESKPHLGRVICNMWCGGEHGASSLKQPQVTLNAKAAGDPAAVGDHIIAAQRLLVKIENDHAGCVAAAEAAKAKARQTGVRADCDCDYCTTNCDSPRCEMPLGCLYSHQCGLAKSPSAWPSLAELD